MSRSAQRGFTLLEMGIVIVVIGLITGGILVGQDLIRTAEVQSIVTSMQKYQAATGRFQSQFASLPGDMPDASSHWAGAADGDGDSFIDNDFSLLGPISTPEAYQFWLHLNLAGEIAEPMTGSKYVGTDTITAGLNAPTSKIGGSVLMPGYDANTAFVNVPAVAPDNFFIFSGDTTANLGFPAPILTPGEAMMIDTKIDNGTSNTGSVVGYPDDGTCITGAVYMAADTRRQCSLIFLNAF